LIVQSFRPIESAMTEEHIPRPRTRLYLITPPVIDDIPAFAALLETCLEAGDIACLQIRMKNGDDIDEAATRAVTNAVLDMCQSRGTIVLINDSPKLAAELGADGAHVGKSDMDVADARALLGEDAIIGATAHNSRHDAMLACEAGADYAAFGAFFPTNTKHAAIRAELETLEIWQEMMEPPCVAIGGITIENARSVIEAGADFIAVSSGVWDHPKGAIEAVVQFNELLDELTES